MDHGVLSLAPAAVAIALAVLTRNVIVSLFSAVALAGIIHLDGDVIGGVAHSLDKTVVGAIADVDHAKTILFTVMIGAMVGVIGRSGGTRSLVEALARRAKSPRSVQVLSWLAGLIVFFDDYANCMIVGSSMGPLCDRYKVSRAKLAYIVDSTAAPVASLALISTWVGFEVGVIEEGLKTAKVDIEAYGFFVAGWPYRFYPVLAMAFVGMVAISGRDFGAMRRVRAAQQEKADPPGADTQIQGKAPAWVAVTPILVLVGVTMAMLWLSGQAKAPAGAPLFKVLEQSDGYGSIVYGSFCALSTAFLLTVATRSLKLKESTEAAIGGMKLMFEAMVVLLLAWSLSAAMKELNTPQYLVSVLRTALPAPLLPTITFLVGAVISFAVGSSYTTMGIMMPMVVPLAFELSPDDMMIPLAASGSVLAGACFGDHCSPISDTTVLSSIGSGCKLLDHVRTQLPYALVIGVISVACGTLPAGYGLNPWICLGLGAAAALLALRLLGKPLSEAPEDEPSEADPDASPA